MQTLPTMLLLPCFPRYRPGVPLTEVSQLPEEAAIGLVLTVQVGRVVWNGERTPAAVNAQRVAAKRNEGTDTKRATDTHFDLKILVNFVFGPVAVECLLQEGGRRKP